MSRNPHQPKGLNRNRLTIRLIALAMIMVSRFMVSIHEQRYRACNGVKPWWAKDDYFGKFGRQAAIAAAKKKKNDEEGETDGNNDNERNDGNNDKKDSSDNNSNRNTNETEEKKIMKKLQQTQLMRHQSKFRDESASSYENAKESATFDGFPSDNVTSLFQTSDVQQQQRDSRANNDTNNNHNTSSEEDLVALKQRMITQLSQKAKTAAGEIVHTVARNPNDVIEVMTTSIQEAARTLEEIPFKEDFDGYPVELTNRVFDGIRKAHSFIADLLRYRSFRRRRFREEVYGFPDSEGSGAAAQVLKNAMMNLSPRSSNALKRPQSILPGRDEAMIKILEAAKNSQVFRDWPQSIFHHVADRSDVWKTYENFVPSGVADVDNKAGPVRRYQCGETIVFHGEKDQKVVWFLLKGVVWELDKADKKSKRCGLKANGKPVNLHGVAPSVATDVLNALNAMGNATNSNNNAARSPTTKVSPPNKSNKSSTRRQSHFGPAAVVEQQSDVQQNHGENRTEESAHITNESDAVPLRRQQSMLFNQSTTSSSFTTSNASTEDLYDVTRRFFSSSSKNLGLSSNNNASSSSASSSLASTTKPCVLRDGACILQVENKNAFVAASNCIVAQLPLSELENCFCGRGNLRTSVFTGTLSSINHHQTSPDGHHHDPADRPNTEDASPAPSQDPHHLDSNATQGTGFENENDLYSYTPSNPTEWGQLARARQRLLSDRCNFLISPMTVEFLKASPLLARLPDGDADSIIGHIKKCTFLKNATVVPRVIEDDDDNNANEDEVNNNDESAASRKRKPTAKLDPVEKWKILVDSVRKGDVHTNAKAKAAACFCSDPSAIRLLQESIIWIVKGTAAAASQRRTRASSMQWFRVKFFNFDAGTTLGEPSCYFQKEPVFDVTSTSMIDVYYLPRQALLQRTMFDLGFRNAISEGALFLRQATGVNTLTIRTLRAVRWIRAAIEIGLITDFHLFDAVRLFEYRTFNPGELLACTSDQIDSIFVVAAGHAVHSNSAGTQANRSVPNWTLIGSEAAVHPALRWNRPIVAMSVCECWVVSPFRLAKALLSIPEAMRIVADDGVTIIAAKPQRPPAAFGGESNVLYQQQLAATAWDESRESQKTKLLALRNVSNRLFEFQDEVVKCVPRSRLGMSGNHQQAKIDSYHNQSASEEQQQPRTRHILDESPLEPLKEMIEQQKLHVEYVNNENKTSSSTFKSLKNLPPRKHNVVGNYDDSPKRNSRNATYHQNISSNTTSTFSLLLPPEKSSSSDPKTKVNSSFATEGDDGDDEQHHIHQHHNQHHQNQNQSPLRIIQAYQDQFLKQEMIDRVNKNWREIVEWSSPERKRREDIERAKKLDAMLHSPPKMTVKDQLIHGLRKQDTHAITTMMRPEDEGGNNNNNNNNVARSLAEEILMSHNNINQTNSTNLPHHHTNTNTSGRSSLRAVEVDDDFAGHLVNTQDDPTKTEEERDREADDAMKRVIQKIREEGVTTHSEVSELEDDRLIDDNIMNKKYSRSLPGRRLQEKKKVVVQDRLFSVQLSPSERMNRQISEKMKMFQSKAPHLMAKYAHAADDDNDNDDVRHYNHHKQSSKKKRHEERYKQQAETPPPQLPSSVPSQLPPFIQQLIANSADVANDRSAAVSSPQRSFTYSKNNNKTSSSPAGFGTPSPSASKKKKSGLQKMEHESPFKSQCGSLVMRARDLLSSSPK